MKAWLLIIFLSVLVFGKANAIERSDAFIIRVFDKKVKVLSPRVFDPKLNVIIENKTLVKITGKIQNEYNEVYNYISIKSGKFQSIFLNMKKGDKLFFVPLSPPFQKIELILGNKPYEIPPKR